MRWFVLIAGLLVAIVGFFSMLMTAIVANSYEVEGVWQSVMGMVLAVLVGIGSAVAFRRMSRTEGKL